MNFLDLLKSEAVNLILPLAKTWGEAEIVVGLDLVAAKEGDAKFALDLQGFVNILKRVDLELKAKGIGDTVAQILLEAAQTDATKHNITLV